MTTPTRRSSLRAWLGFAALVVSLWSCGSTSDTPDWKGPLDQYETCFFSWTNISWEPGRFDLYIVSFDSELLEQGTEIAYADAGIGAIFLHHTTLAPDPVEYLSASFSTIGRFRTESDLLYFGSPVEFEDSVSKQFFDVDGGSPVGDGGVGTFDGWWRTPEDLDTELDRGTGNIQVTIAGTDFQLGLLTSIASCN